MSLYERAALLGNQSSPQEHRNQDISGSSSSDEWCSSYSSNSSLSGSGDSDDSYIPEWDKFVQNDGNLFYIEYDCHQMLLSSVQAPSPTKQQISADTTTNIGKFNRASTRRSKKSGSKLSKLMNRNLKPLTNKGSKVTVKPVLSNSDSTKVKFSEIPAGEVKEISVFIDPAMRHKFGRRASVSEAILGVSICAFPDGNRIMIAGYMPNSMLGQDKFVKVGDWLKCVNGEEVTTETIDLILLGYDQPTEIKLTLQRMSGEEQILQHPAHLNDKVTTISEFVDIVSQIFGITVAAPDDSSEMRFGVMYLRMSDLDESGGEGQDVVFCYPPKEINCLYTSRGSFLTLNSLLNNIYMASPAATTVQCNGIDYHVIYKGYGDDLLLVTISSKRATVQEAKLKSAEIIRCMEFLHQTVTAAMIASTATITGRPNYWTDLFTITSLLYNIETAAATQFETALLESHYVPLPKEAQLRIDDALGEMEAMDYREWNDEPLKSHREFYILGSALYFRSFLLATHLPPADLMDIESFLRITGISKLIETQCVRDLVVWQEIYPKSVERGLVHRDYIYGLPKGRWFLAVVARHNMLLAVILESRHDNNDERLCITPSPFYIEEIQDTFEHLKSGGIENLASTWVNCNKRPQIINNAKEDLGNIGAAAAAPAKKTEIISILKRRNNSIENVGAELGGNKLTVATTSLGGGSSVNSQTLSEDSNHDESDSDWDGFPESHRSSSGFDMSDMTETLLREVSDVIPSKLTAGNENVLFYYVQIEVGQGIMLAPTGVSSNDPVICAFRKACLLIHTILQNTIRFKYLLSQESSKPNTHRSLVAIKEHGILITVESGSVASDRTEFWVIGRLFSSPPKELYVCHRTDVPQNLVEIAFRLSLNSAG